MTQANACSVYIYRQQHTSGMIQIAEMVRHLCVQVHSTGHNHKLQRVTQQTSANISAYADENAHDGITLNLQVLEYVQHNDVT